MPLLPGLFCLCLFMLVSACQPDTDPLTTQNWSLYKSRFISNDGRIVDTGNSDISHSEGQGYGLWLAVHHDDPATFSTIWQWTKANLQVRNDKLFMWRKRQTVALKDEDPNNASDGDILIAWSLLNAAQRWQQPDYQTEAINIIADIKHKLLEHWNGLTILLPGEYGFKNEQAITVNLSYWIYPAFQSFAKFDQDPVWQTLIDSGLGLLDQARFGRWQLPPDWLQLNSDNSFNAAKSKRFGYDAVRIPLYLALANTKTQHLAPFADCWAFYQGYTPAWFDLSDNIMDSYGATQGVYAIKQLILWRTGQSQLTSSQRLGADQDYYSSTLFMLSKLGYVWDRG